MRVYKEPALMGTCPFWCPALDTRCCCWCCKWQPVNTKVGSGHKRRL